MSPLVEDVDRSFLMAMVIGNVVIAAGFASLVGLRLFHVWSDRRNQLAGSRTHMRLVGLFSLLAVAPAIIAFLFALTILRASLNDVFSERIDNYQNTARDLANGLIALRADDLKRRVRAISFDIGRQENSGVGFEQTPISFRKYIYDLADFHNLAAIYILDGDGRLIISEEVDQGVYAIPSMQDLENLKENGKPGELFFFGASDDEVYDYFQGALSLGYYNEGFLIVYEAVGAQTASPLLGVRDVIRDWDQAVLGRSRLERVFLAGYLVLATIILFGAIWAALWAATRIVQPIGRLVGMADRVSSGDLGARVEVHKDDGELGALARAMNHMTAQLQTQRDDLIDTNRQFDNRRRFTEAVLSGVSAGVLGVTSDGRIAIANKSAAALLNEDVGKLGGANINVLMPELETLLTQANNAPMQAVAGEVDFTRDGRTRTLNVRIEKESGEGDAEYVITFDDITQLVAAQRNTAWSDVARRIAHEIKNPLTPIQLSAERLRRKYKNEIETDPEIFDRCTETIIRQVNDIGRMVDEFSSFARMPKPVIENQALAELIRAAVFPQKVAFPDIHFEVETPDRLIEANCDGRLMVQALSNLLKNAAESIGARLAKSDEGPPPQIHVRLSSADHSSIIEITDNGVGLPDKERHRLAEPYMTTRDKGTGLGLAIVKKVVEEHGGVLEFLDDTTLGDTGARITIRLPLARENVLLTENVEAPARPAAAE